MPFNARIGGLEQLGSLTGVAIIDCHLEDLPQVFTDCHFQGVTFCPTLVLNGTQFNNCTYTPDTQWPYGFTKRPGLKKTKARREPHKA